jgi:ribosomal protein S18 acetylase RimI-like enzyme
MNQQLRITLAKTPSDLQQILTLQKQNHFQNLLPAERTSNGFVTVQHDMEILEKMNASAPQVIAKAGEEVVGYALVLFREFSEMIPALVPMFKLFQSLNYDGRPLQSYNYYVMGQICISEKYRGQGIFENLYQKHKELLSATFDICLTEVAVKNKRFMRAHEKVGFKTIDTYWDGTTDWNIVIWDWRVNSGE